MEIKKELNKKYGLELNTYWVICGTCEREYPSTMEEDYTGDCSECEDLSLIKRLEIKNQSKKICVGGMMI